MDQNPIFVKISEYNEVLETVQVVRKKLEEAKGILTKINDLKNEEDHQVEIWRNALMEIEKKIDFIDHSLQEPESL